METRRLDSQEETIEAMRALSRVLEWAMSVSPAKMVMCTCLGL